jgi:hypothetical protein
MIPQTPHRPFDSKPPTTACGGRRGGQLSLTVLLGLALFAVGQGGDKSAELAAKIALEQPVTVEEFRRTGAQFEALAKTQAATLERIESKLDRLTERISKLENEIGKRSGS